MKNGAYEVASNVVMPTRTLGEIPLVWTVKTIDGKKTIKSTSTFI